MKHLADTTFCSVFTELKSLGVKVPKIKKFKSSIPKQVRPVSSVPSTSGRIFGVCLSEQEKTSVGDYVLPKFIVTSTSYLKKYTRKEIGLFRKAGSILRQRDLRVKLEKGESIKESEPNDIASLLKQWLRELPEPLIPVYLQDLFLRCQNLQVEEDRITAVLLCCHLLPIDHHHTLKYLLEFLSNVATNSEKNKMGAHNLAVIMAPNIFVIGADSVDKSSSNLVQLHTSVVELLINNAHRIDTMSCSSLHLPEVEALKYSTDSDLSIEILDHSPSKSRKKRKSGPVQDLFTGFRKLVGQNSTPPNSSKRLNQDDDKTSVPASRSASKRKADPEQLSMSPLKKKATVSSHVLQNESLNFTPNSKSSQSVFGIIKEKTGSAHSRCKSFGLLRRKEKKRQKSSKSNTRIDITGEPKDSIKSNTFEEKISVSLQEPEEVKELCLDKSSPLLSTTDIDRIISKSRFTKKSISDCFLTVQNKGCKNRAIFSTSSSEGCLYRSVSEHSWYNLRSECKRVSKHNSDVLNKTVETETENIAQSDFPNFSKKISPLIQHKSPKQEALSPRDVNTIIDTKGSFSQINSLAIRDCNQNSLNVNQVLNRRASSRKKKNPENLKEKNLFLVSKSEKPVDGCSDSSNIKDVTDNAPNVTSTESNLSSTVSSMEKVKRKCSLSRQEAFIIKSKSSSKRNLIPIKRSDSTKIANSKSRNSYLNNHNENSNFSTTRDVISSDKTKNTPNGSSDKRRIKRNVRNGSIIRGRPNTVKTGLPSDLCGRYNNDSISVHSKHHELTSTSSVDHDLFINVVNHCEKKDRDTSITLQFQNITLSTPSEKYSQSIDTKVQNSSSEATVSADTAEIKITSKRKMREKIYSNSDSKIQQMKTRSSKVARINSFPETSVIRPKCKKLRAVYSSSPRKSGNKEKEIILSEVGRENVFIQESSQTTSNDNILKTPDENTQETETWVSGRKYLEADKPSEDDTYNKRESIALILKNQPGHVQKKVHLYDRRNSSTTTPMMTRSATRDRLYYDPEFSNVQTGISQKRSTSVKCNRSGRNRNSPLPPPPKFIIPDSPPKSSYPLKELTNISNSEETVFSSSPAKNLFTSPSKDKNSPEKKRSSCTLQPKRNSYCGHTPYKFPKDRNKVLRSESSPLLQKSAKKSSRKSQDSFTQSPLSTMHNHNSSLSNKKCFSSPIVKTKSSLSIEKLRSDQLMDEWHCEV